MQNSDGTIKKLSPAAARELLDSKDFRGQIIVQPSRRTKDAATRVPAGNSPKKSWRSSKRSRSSPANSVIPRPMSTRLCQERGSQCASGRTVWVSMGK